MKPRGDLYIFPYEILYGQPDLLNQNNLYWLSLEMSSLSEYAIQMTHLSALIFGEVAVPTDSKSMKVGKLFSEQPLAKRKETYDWYPPHNTHFAQMRKLRFFGLYRDEHQDFKEDQKKEKGKYQLQRNNVEPISD
uniref:Small ribosomal subunit protein mS33 n=1 Tax=Monodelphis domestica TaxID=13616 RepID=A0A5F8GLL0_MONDO